MSGLNGTFPTYNNSDNNLMKSLAVLLQGNGSHGDAAVSLLGLGLLGFGVAFCNGVATTVVPRYTVVALYYGCIPSSALMPFIKPILLVLLDCNTACSQCF